MQMAAAAMMCVMRLLVRIVGVTILRNGLMVRYAFAGGILFLI